MKQGCNNDTIQRKYICRGAGVGYGKTKMKQQNNKTKKQQNYYTTNHQNSNKTMKQLKRDYETIKHQTKKKR